MTANTELSFSAVPDDLPPAIIQLQRQTRGIDRYSNDPDDALMGLHAARCAAKSLEAITRHLVNRARLNGATWDCIGDYLGVTRQAAQQRYGRAQ